MEASSFSMLAATRGEYPQREGQAVCAMHGAYTFRIFTDAQGNEIGRVGEHCAQCVEAQRAEQQRQDEAAQFQRALAGAGIPSRYRQARLSDLRDAGDAASLAVVEYADNFGEARRLGRSMILLGPPGTGKTHAMCALTRSVVRLNQRAVYSSVANMIRAIRSTWDRGAVESEAMAIERYASPALLCLDEIGVQAGSDNERALIFEVINRRYNQQLPTVIGGNCTADELARFVDERVVDRLREAGGKAYSFSGQSRRKAA